MDGKGDVHVAFSELLRKGLVDKNTPCVSTIRNPLHRLSSAYYFLKHMSIKTNFAFLAPTEYTNPNAYIDAIKEGKDVLGIKPIATPQCDYFPDHAELFNTENLHEHASKYILEKGGSVEGRIEMRKNLDNNLDVFLAEITPDRKQNILDTYAKDFVLWEKAYAVYN
tara:strand:- start:12 stop:512 length:501 start_codon:yes stop_codon:yes gene_type:complete